MRPPLPVPTLSRRARIVLGAIVGLIVLIILIASLVGVYVNWLWFGSVGYRNVYSSVLGTRIMLFFVFGIVMALIVSVNLFIAFRSRPPFHPMSAEQHSLERYRAAIEPRRGLILALVAIVIGLLTGISSQGRWQTWMLWRNGTKFGTKDPQFHKDISYFAFTYPFQRYVIGFLFIAILLSLIGSLIVHYIFGALRIQTPGEKVLPNARAHLSVLLGLFVVLKVIAYYLDRYGLVFSDRGGTTGASYTDIKAVLPIKTILMFVALICAIAFIANVFFRNFALPAIALVLLIFSSVIIGGAYPAIVQQFRVKPNANEKEAPYIERNIAATRQAYQLTKVKYTSYKATTSTGDQTEQAVFQDKQTIPNARLLDPNILQQTFDQYQQIFNYYGFDTKLDIDRYSVAGKSQDYVLGVRELDPSKLSGNQANWINKHLVYTHGNGFVAAPANMTSGNLPDFGAGVGNIPPIGDLENNIQIKQPRIYFGEKFGNDYAITGVQKGQAPREFDQPGIGSADIKNVYNGGGGVRIGNFFNRLVFALKYKERNILFSGAISSNSRILFNRDPRQIVQKVAPFLKVDGDPYPAVVNHRIVWIVDGYTTSDGYPYAERSTLGDVTKDSQTGRGTSGQPNQQVNYIRNSVKATVDAYSGKVTLYQFDTHDPVLKTWMKAFPGLVKPNSAISPELRAHFRYPEDLFKVQRDMLAKYHVSDPKQFYNSQGFWSVPNDPTHGGNEPQPPYYLLTQPPGTKAGTKAEFQLTTVLTQLNRPNMAAYVSVSSDPSDYGTFRVLELPGSSSIPGPSQIQPKMKTDTAVAQVVSQQRQSQNNVIYGNLLTLPVAKGLLYVEPLYAVGNGSTSYPQLLGVIVAFGENIGYGTTMADALKNLFENTGGGGQSPPSDNKPPPSNSPSKSPSPSTSPTQNPPPSGSISPEVKRLAGLAAKYAQEMRTAFDDNNLSDYRVAQKNLNDVLTQLSKLTGGSSPPSSTPTG